MGILAAILVLLAWTAHLCAWLLLPLPWTWAPLGVAVQAFLHTGLFITAHDAMHGTVAPRHPRVNDALGRVAVGLFAAFSFDALRPAHHRHHATPGAVGDDPDFHRGDAGFWSWYLAFMRGYLSWGQVALMALAYNVLAHVGGVPEPRLVAFWVLPSLLSTLQLFGFGTYRPHRPGADLDATHRARTEAWPAWASFLACWHFGLHLEHHARPGVPWWRLPSVRGAR
jgi:beta-carotene ketolase (CrtW type)